MKYKAGLHKDVATIFDNVWIPQTDNTQFAASTSNKDSGAFVHPKPLAADNWPQKAKKAVKPQTYSSPWSFLSPKARREKKRLCEISRNLLINQKS